MRLAASTSILTQGVIDLGLAHEKVILEKLSQDYEVHEALSVKHTMELMEQGVDVIYQARLLNEEERFTGFPDFLFRHESGQYQAADAKLSLSEDKKGNLMLPCKSKPLSI